MESKGHRFGIRATRTARTASGVLAAVVLVLPLSGTAQAANRDRHSGVEAVVVVRATSGHITQARADVVHLGGNVGASLPNVNGFKARIPLRVIGRLRQSPGIAGVTQVGVIQ
jgi:hypothetical protein